MGAISNLTIKKADDTTNITYTAVSPSAGDGVPAIWKSQTVGSAQAHQPEFRYSAREADGGKSRKMRATYQYPQIATDSTTGLTSVVNRATFTGEWTIPKGMTQTDLNEFVYQCANILDEPQIKDDVKNGQGAT